VLVEYAFFASLSFLFIFGAIEFTWIANNRQALLNGAVQGARLGAMGKPLADVQTAVQQGAHLSVDTSYIIVEYSSATDGTGSWNDQSSFDDPNSGSPTTGNQVPAGMLIRVRVNAWPYHLLTGSLFSWLPNASGGTLPLSVKVQVRRLPTS
jgi:Flp pilus assembly protein TadG